MAHHSLVGRRRSVAKSIRIEHATGFRTGFDGDLLKDFGVFNVLGEDGFDPTGFDFLDEVLHFLGGWLVGCGNTLNGKNLKAMIPGEVSESLVGGHEDAMGLRERGQLEANPLGKRCQSALKRIGIRLIRGLASRIGGDECVADLRRHGLNV